jgi:hypothetical protein
MRAKRAKDIARRWVIDNASQLPGFCGAFYHGSVTRLPGDAVLPPSSDLDIMVVLDDPPPVKLGKFLYRDVLLEVSYISSDALGSPDQILGQAHVAGSFRDPSVIADPSGHLTRLQAAVSRDFCQRRWVRKRCKGAEEKALRSSFPNL